MTKQEAGLILERIYNNCEELDRHLPAKYIMYPDYFALSCFLRRLPDEINVDMGDVLKSMGWNKNTFKRLKEEYGQWLN